MLKDGGVTFDTVHRGLDDPNMVIVYHRFEDESSARAYVAMFDSDQFQALAKEIGIDTETLEVWLLEFVEDPE